MMPKLNAGLMLKLTHTNAHTHCSNKQTESEPVASSEPLRVSEEEQQPDDAAALEQEERVWRACAVGGWEIGRCQIWRFECGL
eukprot:2009854-Rhodomonas_salina.1